MERTIDHSYEQKIDTMKNSLDKASEDVSRIQSLTRNLRDLEAKYELAKESLKKQQEVEKESSEIDESPEELDLKLALARNEVEECNRLLVAKREELASLHKNLTEKMKHLVIDLEQSNPLQHNAQVGSSVDMDGRAYCLVDKKVCRLILEDDMNVPDLTAQEVITALNYSRDPANFVLEVILGSYKQHVENGGAELDASVAKTITLLLDQLVIRRPLISRIVKKDALKLATMWKENITRETTKGTEVYSFLLFLVVYELKFYLNTQEILGLLVKVSQMRNAPSIFRSLRYDDKIPKLISTLMNKNKYIEAARFSCAFGLHHIHPLDSLLENCLDRLRKSVKDKATEIELKARKAIRNLVFEYKLESFYDISDMTRQIVELETRRSSSMAASLIPVVSIGSSSVNITPPVQPWVEKRRFGDDQGSSKRPRR